VVEQEEVLAVAGDEDAAPADGLQELHVVGRAPVGGRAVHGRVPESLQFGG
jgi:hypothetical protein